MDWWVWLLIAIGCWFLWCCYYDDKRYWDGIRKRTRARSTPIIGAPQPNAATNYEAIDAANAVWENASKTARSGDRTGVDWWIQARKREKGECYQCVELAVPGRGLCEFHAEANQLKVREAKLKWANAKRAPITVAQPHMATKRAHRWSGTYTKSRSKELLLKRFGSRCWGCGIDGEDLQVDHIRARKARRGMAGDDELYNLALLCGACNRRKSNTMTLEELRKANSANGDLHVAQLADLPDLFEAQQWAVNTLRGYDRARRRR